MGFLATLKISLARCLASGSTLTSSRAEPTQVSGPAEALRVNFRTAAAQTPDGYQSAQGFAFRCLPFAPLRLKPSYHQKVCK